MSCFLHIVRKHRRRVVITCDASTVLEIARKRPTATNPPVRAAPGDKRPRGTQHDAEPSQTLHNESTWRTLNARFPGSVCVRTNPGATPLADTARAQSAARLRDLRLRVATAGGVRHETTVSQWDELRIWDPGD